MGNETIVGQHLEKDRLLKTSINEHNIEDIHQIAKSIGIGFRKNLNFNDISIINDKLGKPYYAKTKKITQIIKKEFKVKNFNCFLSISDEKEYSTAFAIIEKS